MSRNERWAATAAPGIRRAMLRSMAAEITRLNGLAAQSASEGVEGRAVRFGGGAAQLAQLRASVDLAELIWVSRDMGRVALDASQDVPEITVAECPAPHGMMLFAEPLPALTLPDGLVLRGDRGSIDHREPVPVDGLTWTRGARAGVECLAVELLVRTGRLPAPLYGVDIPVTPYLLVSTPLPVVFDGMKMSSRDSLGELSAEGDADPQVVALLAFLVAAWVLMATPTVAERAVLDGRWGGPPTAQTRPGDLVTVVDLRPLRQVRTDRDRTGRHLTTRQRVRGHWTHQAYGPGGSLRRLQWVADYIRGPEGAPLVLTDEVMVWRH